MFICKCRKWDASNSSRKGLQRRPNSCVTTVRFYGGMNQVIALMKTTSAGPTRSNSHTDSFLSTFRPLLAGPRGGKFLEMICSGH